MKPENPKSPTVQIAQAELKRWTRFTAEAATAKRAIMKSLDRLATA